MSHGISHTSRQSRTDASPRQCRLTVHRLLTALGMAIAAAVLSLPTFAADWPHWRGPAMTGISAESELISPWPDEGPQELWRVKLGGGFSAVSVVADTAFTMYGDEEGEYVVALSTADGSVRWKADNGGHFENEYGNGPRATPTVHDGRVYAYGATGNLQALDAADGSELWSIEMLETFEAESPEFGLSASPVVLDGKLIAVAGGEGGTSLVALDPASGDLIWTSLDDKAGYSTPILIDVEGTPQLVVLTAQAVVGVAPADGKELWRQEWITTLDANVATPICEGGRLFISTGYGTGCGLFELKAADGKPTAEPLWANKDMKNYFSTSVLIDGHVYGFNNTMLSCMSWESGETLWRARGFNRGSLIAAAGKLIVLGERGALALAEAASEEYREISRTQIFEGRAWTVPTLADGKLYLRNEEEVVCLQVGP